MIESSFFPILREAPLIEIIETFDMTLATVFFHTDNEVISREVDLLNDTIGSLFPNHQSSHFVLDGRILTFAFTLAYSGVVDGSHIYIREKKKKIQRVKPLKFVKNWAPPEALDLRTRPQWFQKHFGYVPSRVVMQQFIDNMTDPSLPVEVSRLRDLFFRKIEGTIDAHKRLMKIFLSPKSTDTEAPPSPAVVIQRAESPSTAELPVLWGNVA